VRVGVRDTGPGLSPEKLERLFEPFYNKAKWDGHGTFDLSLDRRSPWRTAVGDRARITGCGLSVYDTCSAGVISRWSCCNQSEPGAPPPPFKPRRSSEGE
jgi:hypothetical protein